MTTSSAVRKVIDHLKSQRVIFEPGLTDREVARIEDAFSLRLPPDLKLFLQTALPVTGGFPNWRSESEDNLHYSYLDRPARGILFDVEHNDFWPEQWGPRPTDLSDALAEAAGRLKQIPPLIPVRSHHFLPAGPGQEGNPVFSVRQTDIACVGSDLTSYLLNLFKPEGHTRTACCPNRIVPFWTAAARTSRIRVPNLAGPAVSGVAPEYARLHQAMRRAGFWAELLPLNDAATRVAFDRREPTGVFRHGEFWVTRKEFGWLLGVSGPRFYFAPDAERIPELCLALVHGQPEERRRVACLPFQGVKLDDAIRQEFGLVAIHPFTDHDDEREQKLRAWERLGWRAMSRGQEDAAWNEYQERIEPQGQVATPAHSMTWDIAHVYLLGEDHLERLEEDLTLKALKALQGCTPPGEELLALNWNHPCYFLDPHAGLAGACPSSWAVPVLPNGDFYHFLARDYRFGILGNCVAMTMCVFGQELLDAFAADLPLAFNRPTWAAEERQEMEQRWARQGWQRLTAEEKDDVWQRFDSHFGFYRRRTGQHGPAIAEPTPSLTWSITPSPAGPETGVADLTRKILAALQKATRPGEQLYALDSLRWYEHYTFDPHRLNSAGRDSWALAVYPDVNFGIFVAPDFRFGVFGNPLEKSFCVFGQELLDAILSNQPTVFGKLLRRDAIPEPLEVFTDPSQADG
jgi:hypothetical protein